MVERTDYAWCVYLLLVLPVRLLMPWYPAEVEAMADKFVVFRRSFIVEATCTALGRELDAVALYILLMADGRAPG